MSNDRRSSRRACPGTTAARLLELDAADSGHVLLPAVLADRRGRRGRASRGTTRRRSPRPASRARGSGSGSRARSSARPRRPGRTRAGASGAGSGPERFRVRTRSRSGATRTTETLRTRRMSTGRSTEPRRGLRVAVPRRAGSIRGAIVGPRRRSRPGRRRPSSLRCRISSTILLVDDEDAIQSLLTYPLERDGYRVVQARDGDEALRRFAEEDVDLVVLDIMLPRVDGLEVCRRLRAESTVPIIMLTARDDELDKVLGLELGADDYITKPFSIREFRSRVRALLRRAATPHLSGPPRRAHRPRRRHRRPAAHGRSRCAASRSS